MGNTYKVVCNCKHEFQDSKYGNNVRIANKTAKEHVNGTVDVRCTICNKLHVVNK